MYDDPELMREMVLIWQTFSWLYEPVLRYVTLILLYLRRLLGANGPLFSPVYTMNFSRSPINGCLSSIAIEA